MWELNEKYNCQRIFLPDERKDIVLSFRYRGLKKAISVARNTDGIRPAHRFATMDNLFFTNNLFINHEDKGFISEITSFRRKTASDGTVLNEIDSRCLDHIIDACGYAIGAIVKGVNI